MANRRTKNNNKTKSQQAQQFIGIWKQRLTIAAWLVVILVTLFFVAKHIVSKEFASTEVASHSSEIDLLQQIIVPESIANEEIHYCAFTVHFNPERGIPNATIYHLTAEKTDGNAPRANDFVRDNNVPSCPNPWDYSYSGYARGHMTPAGDMKWNSKAMEESFFMTNICPQNHHLNKHAWADLETKVRQWAERDSSLIVATGPIIGNNPEKIGNKIAVPEAFFKVILYPNLEAPRAIAFIIPNQAIKKKLYSYATTVNEVEARTGLDFFSALDDNIEVDIEQHFNLDEWEQHR